MKILLIPFLIVLAPIFILFFVLRHLNKTKKVSVVLKIALGLVFMAIGIAATFFAMIISISGMSDEGITCATGAVAFIPLGFLTNVIGIPLCSSYLKAGQVKIFK